LAAGVMTVYLNQVIGLPVAMVGVAIMISLIFDAVVDPLIGIWSDNNEYTLENGKVLIEDPKGGMNSTNIASADGAKERAKGAAAFEKYLSGLFEDANRWCAGFGGVRHDLKNVIADAARGKYVVMQ